VGDSSGEGQEEGAVLVPGVGPVRGLVRPLALLLGLGLAWGAGPGRGTITPQHIRRRWGLKVGLGTNNPLERRCACAPWRLKIRRGVMEEECKGISWVEIGLCRTRILRHSGVTP